MSKNDKDLPLIICDFHTVSGKSGTLSSFQKRRFQGFISEILSGRSLGRKVQVFQLPWNNQNVQESQTFFL